MVLIHSRTSASSGVMMQASQSHRNNASSMSVVGEGCWLPMDWFGTPVPLTMSLANHFWQFWSSNRSAPSTLRQTRQPLVGLVPVRHLRALSHVGGIAFCVIVPILSETTGLELHNIINRIDDTFLETLNLVLFIFCVSSSCSWIFPMSSSVPAP